MADFIKSRDGRVVVYSDVHAYSQLWMYPYGSDCNKAVKNEKEIKRVAEIGANALKSVHGTSFAVGGICKVIYQASGNSVDWVYHEGMVPYTFAIELRDTGRFGFMLPAEQIIPQGEELFAGFLAAVDAIE